MTDNGVRKAYPLQKSAASYREEILDSAVFGPTSLAPHERLTDLAVVPREKPHTGAAAREQPRASPVIAT